MRRIVHPKERFCNPKFAISEKKVEKAPLCGGTGAFYGLPRRAPVG